MKKTAYLLMFAAILVSSAVGQSSQNLIAYYPFSGNAFDESGNGLNGTVSGPTLTTDRNGISNSAYSFDGDDDYIQISDSELLNPESGVIVEAWINPTSLPSSEFGYGNKQIVMKESEYSLTLYADGRVSFGIGPFPWVHAYTLAAVPLSAWSHIRGEYDRRTGVIRIFLNGAIQESANRIIPAWQNNGPLYIGRNPAAIENDWGYIFSGMIDDVRISKMSTGRRDKILFASDESGNYDIWMMNPDGSDKVALTTSSLDEYYPVVSNSGRYVAYTRWDSGPYAGNIYIYDFLTRTTEQLTTSNDATSELGWSPDDQQICYSRSCGGREIKVIDVSSHAATTITGCDFTQYHSTWHPADGNIYFIRYEGCGWRTFRVPAAGGTVERADTLQFHQEKWHFNKTNPDVVAFATRPECNDGAKDIAIYNRSTGDYRKLMETTYQEAFPSWSPGGASIAYVSDADGYQNVYTTDTSTGTTAQLSYLTGASVLDVCWASITIPGELTFPCVVNANYLAVQEVQLELSSPIVGANIPIKIPTGAVVDSISQQGLVTQAWNIVAPVINQTRGYAQIVLANNQGLRLEPGLRTVANIFYHVPGMCDQNDREICWDTALSSDPERRLALADTGYQTLLPSVGSVACCSSVKGFIKGNVNCDSGVDLADLSLLVAYLTVIPKPVLCQPGAANINGDGGIDISDLSLIIAYLISTPNAVLHCPPLAPSKQSVPVGQLDLFSLNVEGKSWISIKSDRQLRGILIKVGGEVGEINSLVDNEIETIVTRSQDETAILVIDLQGKYLLGIGDIPVVQISGDCRVLHAEAATEDFTTIYASPAVASSSLPDEFNLYQNYPNPFNPATHIKFSLPTASAYTLAIFDIAGRTVAEFTGNAGPGETEIVWNATEMASGVYLYRLTTPSFTSSRKMLLLK